MLCPCSYAYIAFKQKYFALYIGNLEVHNPAQHELFPLKNNMLKMTNSISLLLGSFRYVDLNHLVKPINLQTLKLFYRQLNSLKQFSACKLVTMYY